LWYALNPSGKLLKSERLSASPGAATSISKSSGAALAAWIGYLEKCASHKHGSRAAEFEANGVAARQEDPV
jgi:hypothetical protein